MPKALTPKYPAEIILELRSVDRFIYRVSDLYSLDQHIRDDLFERLEKCHIYILGKRSRLSAVPDTLRVTNEFVSLDVEYKLAGVVHRAGVTLPRDMFWPEERKLEIAAYPRRAIIGRNDAGDIIAETLLANYAHLMPSVAQKARDLEVVYVGKGLSHSAQDRLKKHETLQRILADIGAQAPDDEVFALVYAFEYRTPTVIFSGIDAEITGDAAQERWARALAYRPTLADQVALIEAASIAHFRPEKYNTHYLNFPAGDYPMLKPLRDADFAALVVQLDNENIGGQRIYSNIIKPESTHYIVVDFRGLEQRMSILKSG